MEGHWTQARHPTLTPAPVVFVPGDRIICVEKFTTPRIHLFSAIPVVGTIYIAREVFVGTADGKPTWGCTLIGIQGAWNEFVKREQGFLASRFRKTSELSKEERMELVQPQPVNA